MTNHITHSAPIVRSQTGLMKHWKKLLILGLWIAIVAIYWRSSQQIAPTAEDKIILLSQWFHADGWGPLLFLLIYALQPLVFFPTFVMTLLSGMLYGPVGGMAVAIVGMNCASSVSYAVGYILGTDVMQAASSNHRLQKYIEQLQSNTFETLLTLHLLYIPFDLLSYISGVMQLRWRSFAFATVLGTIPSGLAYVLLGDSLGSLEQLAAGELDINIPLLLISVSIALAVFTLTRYFKQGQSA